MRYIKKTHKAALSVVILLVFSISVHAQWNIPDEAKNTKLPTDPTYKLVNTGKALFEKNCMFCHGLPGEGKNNKGVTDLGTKDYQSAYNAGQTYYQFNEGMGGMPSFKDRFSEDDKWCLTFYIKSFDNAFEVKGEKTVAQNADFELKTDGSASQVFANVVIINKNGDSIPASGVEMNFYVKRIFGNLPIGDAVKTNQVGTAVFNFPDDIPGDENGNLEIFAAFKNSDEYGSVTKSIEVNWGEHLHFVNTVLERSLWGPNDRVPIWLLLSYLFMTGGVWLTIFYVVFQIMRIKKAGQ